MRGYPGEAASPNHLTSGADRNAWQERQVNPHRQVVETMKGKLVRILAAAGSLAALIAAGSANMKIG